MQPAGNETREKFAVAPIGRKRLRNLTRTLPLAALSLLLYSPSFCGEKVSPEYQLKAAFLFHFAQFVEWPAEAFKDASSPMTYCTVGADPFGGALDDSLRDKKIGEHEIRVRHLKTFDGIQDCQVLFIGATETRRAPSVLEKVKGSAILTVGESQSFAEDGGMIEFCLEGNKIRFEINLAAVNAARLKMSARLLTLAKNVIGAVGGN